jgi:hypothetical protein
MYNVRCAGTSKPANSAYSKAATAPARTAALRAGKYNDSRALRRHIAAASANTSPAIMVICRPEIDIR